MPDKQCRAQGAAGIARRGLNPNVVKRTLAQDTSVGHTIERHASGQTEVLHSGLRMDIPRGSQHDLLGHLLDRGREIHITLRQPRIGLPWWAAEESIKLL